MRTFLSLLLCAACGLQSSAQILRDSVRRIGEYNEHGLASFFILENGKKKYGIIDRESKEVLHAQYEKIWYLEGNFYLHTRTAMGVADGKTCRIFIQPTYWTVDPIGPVFMAFDKPTRQFGFYNRKGELFVPMAKYEEIAKTPDGRIRLVFEQKVYYINQSGDLVDEANKPTSIGAAVAGNPELDKWTQHIKKTPSDPEGYLSRGMVYYELKQFPAALADFTKSIELNPTYNLAAAHWYRALIHFEQGKYETALAEVNKSMQPETPYARSRGDKLAFRAQIYCKLGLKLAAAEDENKAEELEAEVKERCK